LRNRSAPNATIVPMLMYEDVSSAIAWLCRVFGLRERLRYVESDGRVTHAQLLFGDHEIMVGWPGPSYQSPKRHGQVCQSVLVHVGDVDAHYVQAIAEGAVIVSKPETQPFGERSYEATDLEGQRWYFSQHVGDVGPEEWGATVSLAPAQ
jgi:PhnB protein